MTPVFAGCDAEISSPRGAFLRMIDYKFQEFRLEIDQHIRNKKLLGTSASLLVTSALLVVTRSY